MCAIANAEPEGRGHGFGFWTGSVVSAGTSGNRKFVTFPRIAPQRRAGGLDSSSVGRVFESLTAHHSPHMSAGDRHLQARVLDLGCLAPVTGRVHIGATRR